MKVPFPTSTGILSHIITSPVTAMRIGTERPTVRVHLNDTACPRLVYSSVRGCVLNS